MWMLRWIRNHSLFHHHPNIANYVLARRLLCQWKYVHLLTRHMHHAPGPNTNFLLPSTPTHAVKKQISYYCAKDGFTNNNRDHPGIFYWIPNFREAPFLPGLTRNARINHSGIQLLLRELLDCWGLSCGSTQIFLRICECHDYDFTTKYTTINHNNKQWRSQLYKLTIPTGAGPKPTLIPSIKDSLGTGSDQFLRKSLEKANSSNEFPYCFVDIDGLHKSIDLQQAVSTSEQLCVTEEKLMTTEVEQDVYCTAAPEATLWMQQVVEDACNDKHIPMNPSVLRTAGLDVHPRVKPKTFTPEKILPIEATTTKGNQSRRKAEMCC